MNEKEYKKIAEELNTIYDDFYSRIKELQSRAADIMSDLDNKIKEDKVQALLSKIKNID